LKVNRVLMVCMGNICRSPTAEAVLRHRVAECAPDLLVEVDSAGTHGYHTGQPPDPRSVAHARRRGVDLSAIRARTLLAADFDRFDFVLCMDEANLRVAERLRPSGSSARLGLLLDYAPSLHRRAVPDPYYGEADGFEQVLDLVGAAADGLIEELRRGGRSPSSSTYSP